MARLVSALHAASGAPELDVSIVGTKQKLFSAVTFKSQADLKAGALVPSDTDGIGASAFAGGGEKLRLEGRDAA